MSTAGNGAAPAAQPAGPAGGARAAGAAGSIPRHLKPRPTGRTSGQTARHGKVMHSLLAKRQQRDGGESHCRRANQNDTAQRKQQKKESNARGRLEKSVVDFAIVTGQPVTIMYGHSSGFTHTMALVVQPSGIARFTSFNSALGTLLAKENAHQNTQRGSLKNGAALEETISAPAPLTRSASK